MYPEPSLRRRSLATILLLLAVMVLHGTVSALEPASPPSFAQSDPRLVILRDTGVMRDGLPVLEVHGGADEAVRALSRGFASTMLDLYAMVQIYLHRKDGASPEPAYLLLSQNEGGFPRFGFFLGGADKSGIGYVDIHEAQPPAGRFGALDQIFPHELAHVILHQLAGQPPPGGSNQIHAVGLRTDPAHAFDEGFAEHFQIMVIDDPNVDPWTRSLTFDVSSGSEAYVRLSEYKRELAASWAPLTRRRMTFPLWYSGTEQVLRYHAVKANSFARTPDIPDELLLGNDPYPAYLLENILPGQPEDPPKAFRRMIATEGVVASFFHIWATNDSLRESYRAPSFYEQFGTEIEDVGPVENVYLKLFHVFYGHKPHDLLALIAAYEREYPDEMAAVSEVTRETFLGQEMVAAPQIWLANPEFQTGTSLYDQFRGLPRTHTFDLNAASEVDLIGVRGVDRILADMIRFQAPYASVEGLADVSGVTPEILEEFRGLERAMASLRSSAQEMESELLLSEILRPYFNRLIVFLALAALLAAFLYLCARLLFDVRPGKDTAPVRTSPSARGVGEVPAPLPSAAESIPAISSPSWIRILLNGVAATLVGLVGAASWSTAPLLMSLVTVTAWLGLPGAAWAFWKTGNIWQAGAVLLAWVVAALPVAMLMTPLP